MRNAEIAAGRTPNAGERREQNSPNSGTLRREQAPALLYYNRHFPEQGNHPALP